MNSSGNTSKPAQTLIAFYGSLMRGQGAQEYLGITDMTAFQETCAIAGDLYDLGEYPGMVAGTGIVHGEIFQILNPNALKRLDDYEDYQQQDEANSPFVRRWTKLVNPQIECWVYFYNRDIRGRLQVTSGNWAEYRRERKP